MGTLDGLSSVSTFAVFGGDGADTIDGGIGVETDIEIGVKISVKLGVNIDVNTYVETGV